MMVAQGASSGLRYGNIIKPRRGGIICLPSGAEIQWLFLLMSNSFGCVDDLSGCAC